MSKVKIFILTSILVFLVIIANAQDPSQTVINKTFWGSLQTFGIENWSVIALIISELSSFLPPKYSGIIKSIISAIFSIKSRYNLGNYQSLKNKKK